MTYRQAVCIYNPAAGRGVSHAQVDRIGKILSDSVGNLRLAPSDWPGHATALAGQAADQGCDLVAVYSGDGTVNEVIQGLAGKASPALLVLPGGTANVLVNELGLPTNPIRAAGLVPQLAATPVRLGRASFSSDGSSRYFLLMCGAGLDAAIADSVSKPLKRRVGQAAYWVAGARFVARRFPRSRIPAAGDGQAGPWCGLVVVSKSRLYGGGLVLTPGAHLLADHFIAAQYPGTSRLAYGSYLSAAQLRLTSRWPGVRIEARDDLALEPAGDEPVKVQVDGEVVGELPARITLSDATCTILMPRHYLAGQQRQPLTQRSAVADPIQELAHSRFAADDSSAVR